MLANCGIAWVKPTLTDAECMLLWSSGQYALTYRDEGANDCHGVNFALDTSGAPGGSEFLVPIEMTDATPECTEYCKDTLRQLPTDCLERGPELALATYGTQEATRVQRILDTCGPL